MQMRQSRSRLMALLLAGLMLFSSLAVLAGCADSEGDATATETGSGVQSGSSAEEETNPAISEERSPNRVANRSMA